MSESIGYTKDDFMAIRFKKKTVKRYKEFSKKISRTYSETLEVMMDFFENSGISPYESIGPKVQTLESLIKKRNSAIIAILRDMEKTQTKPTIAMLQSLFEVSEPKKKPLLVEKKK